MLEDHLEKLRAFHLTAIEGSFIRASKKLGLTQSAVTKTIKILEENMNSTLFIRHARGVTLTPKGALLNEFCDVLFLRVRDVEQQIHSNEQPSGVVKIATHETLGEAFFPRVLRKIGEKIPGVVIELTTENIESHWSKLEAGAIDIVVGLEPHISERFYSRALYSDHFGVFCQKDSPLLHAKDRVPISYAKKAFDHIGLNIEEYLNRFHQGFDHRYSVESFTTVRALITEGVCVGVLPVQTANKLLKDGSLVPFLSQGASEYFGKYRVCATCVHDLKDEPKISKIIEILKNVANTEM